MPGRACFLLLFFFVLTTNSRAQEVPPLKADPLPSTFFVANRESLRSKLENDGCMVLFSGGYQPWYADLTQPPDFYPLPEFYYLTGLNLPQSVLVIFPEPVEIEGEKVKEVLYADERDDFEALKKRSGVQTVKNLKAWRNFCINRLPGEEFLEVHSVFTPFLDDLGWTPNAQRELLADFNSAVYPGLVFDARSQGLYMQILAAEEKDWPRISGTVSAFIQYFPRLQRDPILEWAGRISNWDQVAELQKYIRGIRLDVVMGKRAIREMRRIKSPQEQAILRELSRVNVAALLEGIRFVAPEKGEEAVAATIDFTMRRAGGMPAIPTRVANGQPPHPSRQEWVAHDLKPGEIRVLDTGVRGQEYQSRLTRTVPVSGTFETRHRKVYEIVASAHQKVIQACKPGLEISDLSALYDLHLEKPLLKSGILKRERDLAKVRRLEGFHSIGLSQADEPEYAVLKPGMVLVVETGIYFDEGAPVSKDYKYMVIELRDMVMITENGAEWLTKEVPLEASKVEEMVKGKSRWE